MLDRVSLDVIFEPLQVFKGGPIEIFLRGRKMGGTYLPLLGYSLRQSPTFLESLTNVSAVRTPPSQPAGVKMDFELAGTDNNLLPEFERRLIRNLLMSVEQELDSTDAQIERTRAILGDLIEGRARKAAQIARLRVAVAPQQTLPPELLAKIFIHCMENDDGEEYNENRGPPFLHLRTSAGSLPWTLGHVCSRWRQIVLHEPCLWNRIAILYPIALPMLQEALSRTSEGPISIRFITGPHTTISDNDPLLALILSCTERITELYLSSTSFWIRRFLAQVPGHPLALKSLEFHVESDIFQVLEASPIFKAAPNLCRLSILRGQISVPPPPASFPGNLSIPWSQITHLNLTFTTMSPVSAHEVLRKSANLQECHFWIDDVAHPTIGSSILAVGSIVLPHLHSLQFDAETTLLSSEFIRPLTLPSLKVFEEWNVETDGLPYSQISSLIHRSQCNMIDLAITGYAEEGIQMLLEAIPLVKNFSCNVSLPTAVVEKMANRCLIPHAKMLEFYVNGVNVLETFVNALEDGLFKEPQKYTGLERITLGVTMEDDAYNAFLVQQARCEEMTTAPRGSHLFLDVYRRA
ncbi:hypothetical protein Hypma_011254 [Hypsizygus marmoreus]|uniref:Uncharacterized protein n=1 Tax=Hypsizygus marmoreus TaxID=39966 RepID=A0A369JSA1_HYPMA|nr:hypothetical protein Hypma_011254 [Hypsizygus marmoreus]